VQCEIRRFGRAASSEGMVPTKRFPCSPRYLFLSSHLDFVPSCASRPSSLGIAPDSSFSLSYKSLNCERFPSSVGIVPLSVLLSSPMSVKAVSLPNSVGIGPVNRAKLRARTSSFDRRPSSVGKGPVRDGLLPTTKEVSSNRFPSSVGRVPERLFDARNSS
jgi:hypothetical protein